ncbi:hypothetical protein QB607_003141 [Clostridium botulinum]|nr:hypothetical protein [Clostridium botulinum]EKS4395814.1 hypothetical protein [Clostridium botulinum]
MSKEIRKITVRRLDEEANKDDKITWEDIEDGISIMHPNENMEEALLDSFDKLTS